MNLRRLITRSLWHYRRTNLAVLFGLAVATAVITGSLIVGDSVTGSIRDTALARFGTMDEVVSADHYFRDNPGLSYNATPGDRQTAPPLRKYLDTPPRIAPVLLASGTLREGETEAAVPNVTVLGIDARFGNMFPGATIPPLTGHDVAVNATLARDLGLQVGDNIILTVGKSGAIPADSLFADRSRGKLLRTLRLRVAALLPDRGPGGFTLSANTLSPRNLFIARSRLQEALGAPGKANLMAFDIEEPPALKNRRLTGKVTHAADSLAIGAWRQSWQPEDMGLHLTPDAGRRLLRVQSDGMVLPSAMLAAIDATAKSLKCRSARSSVYLATTITTARPDVKYKVPPPSIAYALVAAGEPSEPFTFRAGGGTAPSQNGVWLNTWAADDLKARIGQPVTLEYLVPQPDGSYQTTSMTLRVEGIVELTGPAADRNLMPPLAGITDSESIDDWEAPFPVDLRRVVRRDDEYWARYHTTPKAFVSLDTARAMWQHENPNADWVTTVLAYPPRGVLPAALAHEFFDLLRDKVGFTTSGLHITRVRDMARHSSRTTTDFAQLFLAMSFFLVLSAAGLAGMLMRLTVERRAAEVGIMAACGFGARQIRRALWGEGALLALGGVLLGVPLGLGYAAGIIHALGSWWAGAVGGAALWLHLTPGALVIGGVSGLIIGALAMIWGTWALGRRRVLELLAGWRAAGMTPERGKSLAVALFCGGLLFLAIFLIVVALGGHMPAEGAFFGSGALLLCAGLCGGYLFLVRWLHAPLLFPTLTRLALRSAAANRGRSLLVMGLLAGAGFIIVSVAANVRDFSRLDIHRKDSGAGGFALRAIVTVPLPVDIATPAGRKHLGFSPEDEALFKDVSLFPLLYSRGDDISCLNLAAAQQPRVVGISPAMIERGGFTVLTKANTADPWSLLQSDKAVFGDADSVMWSLHSALGGKVNLIGSSEQREGQFAGLLPGSIFAGELLISEENFRQLYPEIAQPRYFLIETPPGKEDAVAEALRRNLGDFGLEVRSTRELLNAYAGVQNTYLSTFLALGGLGLMLGTLGLVIVLLRNALERRKEFALLLAQGFTTRDLAAMLAIENAGLLVAGLLCGAVTALVAVAPHLASVSARVNWGALIVVLAGILLVGLASCLLAARAATRGKLLEALREE